jgi:Cdc6-like AAA superfamily ATPase
MARDFLTNVYRLSRLPFELGRYDTKRVGRDAEWKRLLALIDESQSGSAPTNIVLLGTYGSGKSFLLWQLYLHFLHQKRRRVLMTRPVRLLDPEQSRDIARSIVVRIFRRGFDLDTDLGPLLEVAASKRTSIPQAYATYAKVLFALIDPKLSGVAKSFLYGKRITRSNANDLGIPDFLQLKTNEDALDLLITLQLLARIAGYDGVVLAVDEVEYIDQAPRSQQGRAFDSLKWLWDSQVAVASDEAAPEIARLLIVLAATPSFWQSKVELVRSSSRPVGALVGLTPFFDRIPPANVVEMPEGLSQDEARELIVSRMSEARDGKVASPIIPFTERFVEYVFELTQGLPRRVIEICEIVVAEALRRKLPKIDRKDAEEILRDLLIAYEPTAPTVG